jgi:multiple sugar transport system permease protein
MMFLSVSGVKWGEMAATGSIAVLPVILFAILVQKNMIRGLTFGAVKG